MMASDNLLNLQPLSKVSEYGLSLQGLSADIGGQPEWPGRTGVERQQRYYRNM